MHTNYRTHHQFRNSVFPETPSCNNKPAVLLLIAWFFINASQSFAQLGHVQESNWFEITKTPVTCIESSVSEINGKLYMIGGEQLPPNPRAGVSDVRIYDIEADEWTTGTDMPTARPLVPKLNMGTKIYAIGGFKDSIESCSRVEVYDVSTDTWTRVSNMPTPRVWSTACVYDEKIYVIGGISPFASQGVLDIVERYDIDTDTWDTCAPMITGRFVSTACILNDSLFVIGGIKEKGIGGNWPALATVEVYDPRTDTWVQKAHMHVARSEMTNVVVGEKIWVIGGFPDVYGRTVRSSFEVYDPNTNAWTLQDDAEDMHPQGAAYHAINVDGRIYALNAVGPYTTFHPIFPEVYVYNKPIFKVMSNPLITVQDSVVAKVLEPCTLYVVPPGTPAKLDSIIEDSIISFEFQETLEHGLALGDLPPGTYVCYAVASDGLIDMNYFQFRVLEDIPEVFVQVIDDYTQERLSGCHVYLNGKLFEKESEEVVSLTGWTYDTCSIKITRSNYVDFDTTVIVKSDTTLVFALDYALPEPALDIYGGPLWEKSDYLTMKMSQNGTIYITPEGTPAVADSITESAVKSYPVYVNHAVLASVDKITPGTYRIYGISTAGRIATGSYMVQVIDHFPVCIIWVQDADTKEIIDSCLMVFEGDSIPGSQGEFDLTGLVYDTCTIEVTREGYVGFDTTLVALSDTSYVIYMVRINTDVAESTVQELMIFPNPANSLITIQTREKGLCSLEIVSLNGQVIKKMDFSESPVVVDLSSYQSGLYIIRILFRDKVYMGRVVKY